MTLLLGIVRPSEGAWLCADRRVSSSVTGKPKSNVAHKVVGVRCADGALLVGYSGLAAADDVNVPLDAWIRETVRGDNRTVEGTMIHICDRLNRDVHRRWRQHALAINGVAFVGTGGGWFAPNIPRRAGHALIYILTNTSRLPDGQFRIDGYYELQRSPVVSQATFFMNGGGYVKVTPEDIQRVKDIVVRRPRRPENYLGLLASLIRAASTRDTTGRYGISPWSHGWYMPATGDVFEQKSFRSYLDGRAPMERVAPQLLFGVDLSAIAEGFKVNVEQFWEGGISSEELERRTETAARQAIEGRP